MELHKYLKWFVIAVLFNCLASCGTINRNDSSSLTYRGTHNVYSYLKTDDSRGDQLGNGVDLIIKSTVILLAPIDFLADTLLFPIDFASINAHKIMYGKQYPPLIIPTIAINLTNSPAILYKFDNLNDFTMVTKDQNSNAKRYITLSNPYNPITKLKNKELSINWQENQTTGKTHTNDINFKASDYQDNIVLVVVFLPCNKIQHYFYYLDNKNITNIEIGKYIQNRLELLLNSTTQYLNSLELTNKCSITAL